MRKMNRILSFIMACVVFISSANAGVYATEMDEPDNATEIFKFVRRTRERIADIRGNYPIFWKHMGQHLEETKQQRQIQIELRERQNRRRMRGCPAAGFRIDQPISLENFAKLMAKKCHF